MDQSSAGPMHTSMRFYPSRLSNELAHLFASVKWCQGPCLLLLVLWLGIAYSQKNPAIASIETMKRTSEDCLLYPESFVYILKARGCCPRRRR